MSLSLAVYIFQCCASMRRNRAEGVNSGVSEKGVPHRSPSSQKTSDPAFVHPPYYAPTRPMSARANPLTILESVGPEHLMGY